MPDDTRPPALVVFTEALWRAWTKAGPLSYKEFGKRSVTVLGLGQSLSPSTVQGVLKDLRRRRPPRWSWVVRFWTVQCAIAADHGIDPDSLGTLEELKRLHEAADAQRPTRRLAGASGTVSETNPLTGSDFGQEPGAVDTPRIVPVFSEADVQHDEVLASIRRKVGVQWWRDDRDVVPGWCDTYLSLEPAASLIHVYGTAVVPHLLQTAAYANAALQLESYALPAATIARIVELRIRRQQIIDHTNAPRLWIILDESVLRHRLVDAEVMREQLRHLIDISAKPNVTIQVIPSATNTCTTPGYPITLLRFRVHEVPDVAYIEQLIGAYYLHDPHHVSQYVQVWEALALEALQPAETVEYLNLMLRDF